jgi:hypothetical protein
MRNVLTVGTTKVLALTTQFPTRQLTFINLGSGTLYYQVVAQGATSTLTTSNGTAVAPESDPVYTPLNPSQTVTQPCALADVYLISGSSTLAYVGSEPW